MKDKKYRLLLLNAGTRNSLIKQFIASFDGEAEILTSDSFELAPALYEACEAFLIPNFKEEDYSQKILEICKNNKVDAVISLLDPDLSILSKNRELFLDNNIIPIISSHDLVELCFDKYELAKRLSNLGLNTVPSFDCPKSYLEAELSFAKFPAMVKPKRGSGSAGLNIIRDKEDLQTFFNKSENKDAWIIQPYLKVKEYGADLYFNIDDGNLVDYFVKEKVKMRAGETDKSIAIKDERIFSCIKKLSECFDFRGPIDVDIFLCDGEIMISEINPRFGGGYLHAYAAGVKFPEYILRNLRGENLAEQPCRYQEGSVLMKYFSYVYASADEIITK